jgi:hypothetical protein
MAASASTATVQAIDERRRIARDWFLIPFSPPHTVVGSGLEVRIFVAWTILLVAFVVSADAGAAPGTGLDDVLRRTGQYVSSCAEQLAAVVGQEEYVQTVAEQVNGSGNAARPAAGSSRTQVLLSDFALIAVAGNASGWEGFRDVFEVNGTSVRDRKDRLERLFAESPATALRQARTIADESARYNIGPIARNFNVPTAVLFFMHPSNQPRFKFTKIGEAEVNHRRCWIVAFAERWRPTLIRTPANKDVPAKGRAWIEPGSGTVLLTELRIDGFLPSTRESSATLAVDYGLDERLGVWVPTEMREQYRFVKGDTVSTTIGVAKYSNFRRFVTDARLVVPK